MSARIRCNAEPPAGQTQERGRWSRCGSIKSQSLEWRRCDANKAASGPTRGRPPAHTPGRPTCRGRESREELLAEIIQERLRTERFSADALAQLRGPITLTMSMNFGPQPA